MRHVFLDLDGTLLDPKLGTTGSVKYALDLVGVVPPPGDDLSWMIGPALVDSFAKLGVDDVAVALGHYRARYSDTGMFENTPYPGVFAMLAALRDAGHILVLMTAKPHVFARKITAHFGIAPYLTHEFGPEMDGTRNNKGELLAYAMDQIGARADQSVMIGDRQHDMDAARANNMARIAVTWGYGRPAEWAGADAICHLMDDLPGLVGEILIK